MEPSKQQNLVRDLDLTLQPRIAPRYKIWLPLATQQLRLRSLIQIIGHNLKTNVNNEPCWFYYTLHRSSMSSPLYTSEPIDNANPRWSSLEVPTLHATGYSTASEIILRLWKRTVLNDTTSDVTFFTWGISFTGLTYIGPKLPTNLEKILKENTLIFHFHGGYFAPPNCFIIKPELKKFLHISVNAIEIKDSYTVNKLTSLRSKMQALKQQTESVEALRLRIASGENLQVPKYPQTTLNRLLQPRKVNREKKAEILKVRKELEMAKFRTKLLEQERLRKMGELRTLSQVHANIMEENEDHGTNLMEKYRELSKDMERLQEWRQNHIDTRETYLQLTSHLAYRRRQLISELSLIYPIKREDDGKFTINNVYLPDSEDFDLSNDTEVAVALGSVAHTTQMTANFLNIPTRYPIIHYGSRSKIIDHITDSLPDNDRQFPLFARSKDKLQFHYAVYLLNKNIAQLRWYCGLPTADLRATLPNLATLISIKPSQSHLDNTKRTFSTSSLDTEISNGKHNVPLTPPIQKMIFEKHHRSSHSINQLKAIKSSLGNSLDQGLNKPTQPLLLGKQSKRICKSEEINVGDKNLTLLKDNSNNSSGETLNNTSSNHVAYINHNTTQSSQSTNDSIIENNIEITIPNSVSKLSNVADSVGSSGSMRDRSSNSISSCEMALSNSQIDEDESTNDNVIKKGITDEGTLLIDKNLPNFKDIMSTTLKNGDSSEHTSEMNVAQSNSVIDAATSENSDSATNPNLIMENATYTKGHFGKTCLSLNDIMGCTYEESEKVERTSSPSSSYPEECPLSKAPTERQYDRASRSGQGQNEVFKEYSDTDINTKCTKHEPMRGAKSLKISRKKSISFSEDGNKSDGFEASSEYMDFIKRSSENVFARTEALANKQSSFKVMRPRL